MAHKTLFAILYGFPLSLKAISGRNWQYEDAASLKSDLDSIITVCAYAEYYGCLNRIGPFMLDLLFSGPYFWKSVADMPEKSIDLAKKLRSSRLYFDALRHLISRACPGSCYWEDIGNELGVSTSEAEQHCLPLLAEQKNTVAKLKDDLLRLQLTEF